MSNEAPSFVHQATFVIGPDKKAFKLPEVNFFNLPEFHWLSEFLEKRPMWHNKTPGRVWWVDRRNNLSLINDEGHWSDQTAFSSAKIKGSSLSAIVIMTSSLNESSSDGFGLCLIKAAGYLPPHQGSIFILEDKKGEVDKSVRKRLLEKANLAKPAILSPKKQPYLFWEARKKKEIPEKDLTKYEDFWKTLEVVCQNYRQNGFDVVISANKSRTSFIRLTGVLPQIKNQLSENGKTGYNSPEIIQYCQRVKNSPVAVTKLIDGFGLTLKKVHCDCTYEINRQGTIQQIANCTDPDSHDNVTLIKPKSIYKYKIGEYITSNDKCFCGTNFQEISFRVKNKRGLFGSKLEIERSCPHCGSPSNRTEWALNVQIKN